MERRAKPARRSSRFMYPKTAAQELHQSRSAHKNQNPQNGHLILNSEVERQFLLSAAALVTFAPGQVSSSEVNFGEVGNSQARMLSSKGIRDFNPPQLWDRWITKRRPARPRMAPQVRTCMRIVAGAR
jgi:hypothetical protein